MHLVNSQCCTTITTIKFQNTFITPKKKALLCSCHFPFLYPLATMNLLSVPKDLLILSSCYSAVG